MAQVPVQLPGQQQAQAKLMIEAGSSGACFFVTGVKGNQIAKEKLQQLGGHYNEHMRGYRFSSSKLETVCEALQLEGNVDLVDPRRVIQVEFTQKFQWPGDLAMAEQKLKELGLAKKAGGKGNSWVGDLSKAGAFLQMFNFVSEKK